MGKKTISVALILLLLPALLFGCQQSGTSDAVKAKKLIDYQAEKYKDMGATGTLKDGVRTIEINASQFSFEPKLIIVNKGEKIKVIINALDVPHGFEIEGMMIGDYDINTVIRPGFPLEVEFTAEEEGVWEFICALYCGFGHSQMKGTFVVR